MGTQASTPEFEHLLEYLKQSRGFDFTAYKRSTLSRRVAKRMQTVGAAAFPDYEDYLEVHPDEFEQLFNTILINVTRFFRDPSTFDFLATQTIPAMLQARDGQASIRVWCAGAASGEECYSIAILLAEALGTPAYQARVKIYATDIDEEELATARQGTYTDRQIEAVPQDLRAKYFTRAGTRWTFRKGLRRNVIFGRHDLLDDAPISKVDLLTCRNTLMYFNHEAQARIVARFNFALRPGGFLLLGKAEMLVTFAGAFAPVDLKHRIFQKIYSSDESEALPMSFQNGRDDRHVTAGTWGRLREIAFDQDPLAQFVVDEKRHLVLANVCARELFGLSARDLGRPLQDLELSYKPADLRSAIDDAHARRQIVQLRDVPWNGTAGDRYFTVQVTPILDGADASLGTKVIFIDITRQHELQEELQRSRQDLETAYEELQSTNEELETTNEELQSTVEELETTNEELQSTNEELETMNEELQSTNEELEGVNQELRDRGFELGRSNVFLSGILRSVPYAVVVLNREFQVELWNETAADLWGVRQDEARGKHFFALDIGLPLERLGPTLNAVLNDSDRPVTLAVDGTNRRGKPIRVKMLLATVGGTPEVGKGIIILMDSSELTAQS